MKAIPVNAVYGPLRTIIRIFPQLSFKQSKIAEMVRRGMKTRQIAEAMDLTERTISSQRAIIREKVGIRNRKIGLRDFLRSL
jgi:DNA-binding NarL/FixJ family response regulator